MYELARIAADADLPDGPFKGVPFLMKDTLAVYAGVPLTNGSRFFKDFVPDHDSEMAKRFKAAGVIVVGETDTPEFGPVPFSEPELFGPTRNPWDVSRTPLAMPPVAVGELQGKRSQVMAMKLLGRLNAGG